MLNAPHPAQIPRSAHDRRSRLRYPVVTSATVKPIPAHAFDFHSAEAFSNQLVVVHDISLKGIGFRSRLPLDICSRYRIQCSDKNVYLRSSQLRVVSCRRSPDGMYEIGAELHNAR